MNKIIKKWTNKKKNLSQSRFRAFYLSFVFSKLWSIKPSVQIINCLHCCVSCVEIFETRSMWIGLDDFFSSKNQGKPKIEKIIWKQGKRKKEIKKMSNRKKKLEARKNLESIVVFFSPFSGSTHLFFTIWEVHSCFSLSGKHSSASRESTIVIFTFRETKCG